MGVQCGSSRRQDQREGIRTFSRSDKTRLARATRWSPPSLIADALVTAVEVGEQRSARIDPPAVQLTASRGFAGAFVRGETLADASGSINVEGGCKMTHAAALP